MYDESMQDVLGLYFTFNSFSHIEQKNTKYGISSINTSHKILDIFLIFSWLLGKTFQIPDIPDIPAKVATLALLIKSDNDLKSLYLDSVFRDR